MAPRLSVLDLVPVREGQTTAQALNATLALARAADEAGVHRYWLAEHHNMPAVASTSPPVLVGLVAGATRRMRVGSGGVMLPNHAPLAVAEQFALLEAAYPGRIDLGLGRAPGSDPVTNWALRHGGPATGDADHFPEHVGNLIAMLSPAGVGLQLQGRSFPLRATPVAVGAPPVWLLGSSDYSAGLAATMGLPYVFAHHFSGSGTARALQLYRDAFEPSDETPQPQTFLTVNAVVASSADEAFALARPNLLSMVALRTGGELGPQRSVEDAAAVELSSAHLSLAQEMQSRWLIGTADQVAADVRAMAADFGVDEVMVHPIAGAHRDDPVDRSVGREETVRLLADALR